MKWGGAAVTVLLVVVWIGSGWVQLFRADAHGGTWHIERGILMIESDGTYHPRSEGVTEWSISEVFSLRWRPSFESDGSVWWTRVPLWIPTILVAITTASAWHLDTLARRRARLNLCLTGGCNYDRTGLAAGAVCPECGRLPA